MCNISGTVLEFVEPNVVAVGWRYGAPTSNSHAPLEILSLTQWIASTKRMNEYLAKTVRTKFRFTLKRRPQFGVFQVRTIKTFHETNSLYSCLTSDRPGLMLALSAKMPSRLLRATQKSNVHHAEGRQLICTTSADACRDVPNVGYKSWDVRRRSMRLMTLQLQSAVTALQRKNFTSKPARQWRTVFKAQAQKIRISTQLRGSEGTQPPTSPCIETSHGGTRLIPQMEKIFQSAGHFPRIFATLRSNESEKRT